MSLIESLSGHHLLNVEIQPDGTYFLKSLDAGEVERLDEVWGAFRKGDAATLEALIEEERMNILDEVFGERKDVLDLFERLQKACQAMEAEDGENE
jgi:hypothetical protein